MKLSIIIPSFNTSELTLNCLNSIFKETKSKSIKFEVIVVDNASTDKTVELIKKRYFNAREYEVKLIENKKNLGFSKANNLGAKQAKGKYLLFLNSDTIILDNAINKAISFIETEKEVDVLGCQLLNQDKTIQPSGGFLPKLRNIFYMMFFIDDLPLINNLIEPYQQSSKSFYKNSKQVGWVTGAFLLTKKEVFQKVGMFDESIFMYGEEVDFCIRANKAGFKCWFYSHAKVVHLKGRSSDYAFEKAVLGEYQSLKQIFKKHKPGWEMPFLKAFLKIGAVLRMVLFGILKQDKLKRKVYEKAFKMA